MGTNEIAAAVQAGETDYLQLWEAVQRFAYDRAYRWALATEGRSGMEVSDFVQCAFLALVEAVDGWDSGKGAFLTLYGLKMKAAFTEAAGQRTERARRDPLRQAASLDAPLTDDDGDPFTLADVVPDPAAVAAIDAVEESDFQQRRRKALEAALAALPADQRAAVVGRYCCGQKTDTRACGAALRALRHPSISQTLKQYV